MECYIVCNMFPPLAAPLVRAPGLRAEQLAHQAAQAFDKVRYVMTKSRFDMLVRGSAVSHSVRAHPDFLILHDSYLRYFVDRVPRSVFVFSQVEMPELFNLALKRHYVVYDLLAPKALELRCGRADPKQIKTAEQRHRLFAQESDRILVNGEKLRAMNADLLDSRKDDIRDNPFCPVVPDARDKTGPRDRVTFFSSAQPWTDNRPFLDAMAQLLSRRSDLQACFMSAVKPHENPESIAISRLQQLPNVRRITALSYPAHLALLARSTAVMDWSRVNEERRYSTSTRLIQAVGRGAPVFGNGDTGLAHYWSGYPGLAAESEPDAAMLEAFIDTAAAGGYAAALRRAEKWNRAVLADTRIFGGIQ